MRYETTTQPKSASFTINKLNPVMVDDGEKDGPDLRYFTAPTVCVAQIKHMTNDQVRQM